MDYKISNESITLTVKSMGAEISSLCDNQTGQEYIWEADPAHWGSSSPILFPVVGGLAGGLYTYEGQKYTSCKHGFARRTEFKVTRQEKSEIWFELKDSAKTLENYPFHFTLKIGYELCGKSVKVLWKVFNDGDKTMYFSLGGHPAFACPPAKNGASRVGCYIGFEEKDSISATEVTQTGYIGTAQKVYPLEKGLLKIEDGLFDRDALVIDNEQVQAVTLYDAEKRPYVTVDFDVPVFGVWSMPESDACFICIEPWYGLGDREEFRGELKDRVHGNSLEPKAIFEKEYTITVM